MSSFNNILHHIVSSFDRQVRWLRGQHSSSLWFQITSKFINALLYIACAQGVLVKTRYIRAGQTFEVPILMSSHYSDWRVVSVPQLLVNSQYKCYASDRRDTIM